MKTFPNWRMVGRAMRWAREQDGVTYERTNADDPWAGPIRHHKWAGSDDRAVLVTCNPALAEVWISAGTSERYASLTNWIDGQAALRVLVALDLIDEGLADPHAPGPRR